MHAARDALLLAGLLAFASPAPADDTAAGPVLTLSGLTFVASRDRANRVVLRADRVRFEPATALAELEGVHVRVSGDDGAVSFEMACDEGQLNLETSDFSARGQVVGRTAEGVRIATSRARYDHAEGVVHSSVPVEITQSGGLVRAEQGFRYDVHRRRLKVLGAVETKIGPEG